MNNLRVWIPILVLLGVGGYFGYHYLWLADDERIIHAKVDELAELASKEGEETVFVGVGQARRIANHFTEEFVLGMGRPFPDGTGTREDLMAAVTQARGGVDELRLRVSDRDLTVDASGESAVMELTGRGLLSYQGHGRREDVRRFRVEWVKVDGDWLIRRVDLIDILE